nr:reverse transcriptase domain-containing protein [Tanacetum cinerariifolium]
MAEKEEKRGSMFGREHCALHSVLNEDGDRISVPNTTVKLLLFPFSLEGEARIWLDKEPPRSILTWEDLFQTAAVGNFIQNRQNVSNQMRPSGFHQSTQPNNNQNLFQGNNLNQNRQPNQGALYQNRPPQNPNFQAPPQQNTVTQGKFEAYTTANDANMNNLQLKFDNFQRN